MQSSVHTPEEEVPTTCFMGSMEMFKWEGVWLGKSSLKAANTFRSTFHARDDDVFLASPMKTGTTWLKALAHCIVMQNPDDILTKENPHFAVPTIDGTAYLSKPPPFDPYDNDDNASRGARLLHTHFPYPVLPDSIKNSKCKIVYIARNPKDTVVSMWHFFNSFQDPPLSLDKMVDCFCSGVLLFGPFFEHVVGYWEESKKRPDKIMFLKYEDLKTDPRKQVVRIAEFLGRPLLMGDDEAGEIVESCSLERLKNLEVNKSGALFFGLSNSFFFRKGEVDDWKNHLTPEMETKINQMTRLKLEPFGLFL